MNPSVSFAAAFCAAALLCLFPVPWLIAAGAVLLAVCILWRRRELAPLALGALLGCGIGYGHYLDWQSKAWPAQRDKSRVAAEFSLTDFIKKTDRGWLVQAVDAQGRKLRLQWNEPDPPAYACRYSATLQLTRPRGLLNTGLFDFDAWLLSQRFHATGSVVGAIECLPQSMPFWLGLRLDIADWLAKRGDSSRVQATLNGLLIGNYADLERGDWQQLRETGTIHLLSVSGLHIALVAGLIAALVLPLVRLSTVLTRIAPAAIWASSAALIVALAYSLLAGFSVPTQRSLIMVAAACIAVVSRSRWPWTQAFAWALIAVIAINPFSLLSVGFWFSFTATALVLLAAKYAAPLQRGVSYSTRLKYASAQLVALQLLLFAAMLPLLFYSYGRVYYLSLPMNLLAVPWVSFVSLPLAFAAAALLPVSETLANWLMDLSAISLEWYWLALDWATASALNHYSQAQQVSLWQVLLAWLAMAVWVLLPRDFSAKHLLPFTLLPLFVPPVSSWQAGELRIQFLDVGQGLAIVVLTQNHTLLYDAGNRYSSSFDVGRDIVVPTIALLGRDKLDAVVISHIDSDHAAGLSEVLNSYPSQVYAIDAEGLRDKFQLAADQPVLSCEQGLHWQFDGVAIKVVSPAHGQRYGKNASCVLLIENAYGRVLLTGDMERAQELALLDSGVMSAASDQKPLVAISAPHHGSNTSSSASLLSALKPQVAVISAGYLNRYRHPTEKVMARYRQYGVESLNSAELGQINLTLNAAGAQWRSALCEDRSLWRRWRREAAAMCDTSENFVK